MLTNCYQSKLVHIVLNLLLGPALSSIKPDAIHGFFTQFYY